MAELTPNIRPATVEDGAALLAIYAPYVEQTAVTFEYEIPTEAEFRRRIEATLVRYPYLAAEVDGRIVGYAYAGVFKDRSAYDWCAEVSIYVATGCRGRGVGRALYEKLEEACASQHLQSLYACIGYPREEDSHLTLDSVRFHERMGYTLCGRFQRCGYKFHTWYDMVWMEKHLAQSDTPQPVLPFPAVRDRLFAPTAEA